MGAIYYTPSVSNEKFLSPKPLSPRSAMDRRSRRDPPGQALRRASTAPISQPAASTSAGAAAAIAADPEASVESLFNHPSARIVTFMNHESTGRFAPETLVPSGRVDRTLAVGPLRIYKAPGSVTFLNCGSALKPILPKSQCWAIEEDSSKFILQIRAPQFWRIEIPVDTPEQVELAAAFRDVLDTILLFDKTPCPFQRSFTVELPDSPEVKKRPWRPVPKAIDSLAGKLESTSITPSKKAQKAQKAPSSPSAAANRPREARTPGSSRGGSRGTSRGGSGHSTPPLTPGTSRVGEVARLTKAFDQQEEISNRLSGHRRQPSSASRQARRSSRVTGVPPPLSLTTPDRSKSRTSMYSDSGPTSPTASTAGSDSFYSGESWQYSSPPFSALSSPSSAPVYDDDDGICVEGLEVEPPPQPKPRSHYPPSASKSGRAHASGEGAAAMGTGTKGPAVGKGHMRRRSSGVGQSTGSLRRPTLSSLPPPANLLSPPQRRRSGAPSAESTARQLAAQRVMPGAYLVTLMLRVSAKIAAGEWRGVVFGVNEDGERIPVQWDYTEGDSDDEDDEAYERRKAEAEKEFVGVD
ncbi:hypothetical protein MKZ38_005418 [Zalerion maritima]|uniref:Inheritance of peroxisomes protein 1 n=1 Tax=Zalerion maritima TaxID=339359 RepID=A0AAD5RK40_9PEZI|nr:hypothetical protein MKZ38_005418 [Zalerion maritima]